MHLVCCVESSNNKGGEYTTRKQLSTDKDLDKPQGGDITRLLNHSTHFLPGIRGLKKIHINIILSSSSRSRKYIEASKAFIHRRNAISEMHACIQEHRKSHLKKAAVLSR